MSETVTRGLLADLVLTDVGPDHFRAENTGRSAINLRHLFGGQVLAQALLAAARTVQEGKTAHSLHAYFLRAGDAHGPVDYVVERVRDGRRLSCRSVSAVQFGKPIATVMTSFADTGGDVEHQIGAPSCAQPDELPTLAEAAREWGGLGPSWNGFDAIEIRVDPHRIESGIRSTGLAEDSADFIWQRTTEAVPGGQLLQQALLVYMSDIILLAAALVPHGVPLGREEVEGRPWDGVSLDHAIWFHRPVHVDDWLLFAQSSPFAGSGRSQSRAEIFDQAGRLIASTAQEGLIFDVTTN